MHTIRSAAYLLILLGARHALADDTPDAPPAAAGAAAPAPDPATSDEVIVVEAHAPDPSEVRIPAAELREVPGSLGDPVRAVTALPGIVPTEANRPEVYIRGAPPGNTGFLIDGIRVPLLFHGGVASSVVPAAFVDAVDFYASAAPARYGGLAGGAIEIETAAPAPRLVSEVSLKAYEAGGLVESPVDGGRGSVLAGARIGYPELVTAITSSDTRLAYWDYQARASWALGVHDRVGVLALGSHDRLGENQDDGPGTPSVYVEQLASDFHRVDLRYDHTEGASHLRAAVTGGWSVQGAGDIAVRDLSYGARLEGETQLATTVRGRAALQFQRDLYRLPQAASAADSPAAASPANAAPAPRNAVLGGYADLVWRARNDLQLTPGVRFDAYESTRAADGASGTVPVVEPRLGARWRVLPELALVAAAGIVHQYPLLRVGSAPPTAISVPGFWAGSRRLQTAEQASAGAEWLLPGAVTAIATGFGSVTRGLTDLPRQCQQVRTGTVDMPGPIVRDCGDARSTGIAYGLELSLRRPLTERLAGWLSYTLSRATERSRDASGTRTLASAFDRTHVANASLAYQLGARWRTGARVITYSGEPFRVPTGSGGTTRDLRLPWFYRVDLRAERRWDLAHGRSISLVFDLLNATLSRPHNSVTCGGPPPDTQGSCTVHAGSLFVVPSIGVEGSL